MVGLGVDDINLRKEHNYPTLFAGLIPNRFLFATQGEEESVLRAFAAELQRHNRHLKAIQHLAIDMSAAYIRGVSHNFGNARVVYGEFRVILKVVEVCA